MAKSGLVFYGIRADESSNGNESTPIDTRKSKGVNGGDGVFFKPLHNQKLTNNIAPTNRGTTLLTNYNFNTIKAKY